MDIKYIERIKGNGLIAKKKYKKNTIIHVLSGEIRSKPNRYTIEIGKNKHILDKYGIYMNHSFTPNTVIDGLNVIALKDIEINDEITFNYNENETNMVCPFISDNILVSGKSYIISEYPDKN